MGELNQIKDDHVQELLIRLDRNNNVIQNLSKKLNSYTCEPHDASCFEKLHNLRHKFKTFRSHQIRIVEALKKENLTNAFREEVKVHLERFQQLERDMASYLLDTNQYY